MLRALSRRTAGTLALIALAAGFAWVMQGTGFNQNSHYALVKALSKGTPVVDSSLHELGQLNTQDVTRLHGHTYSNKAPGLAFLTVPLYVGLEHEGMRTTGDPTRVLWALGLLGTVLPAVLLLFLVRWVGDGLEPGFGTVAAVALGAGTLLTPFATLFFAHALSALLVFGTFALLWRARDDDGALRWIASAGVCAGLAVVTEYPNALAGAVLGVYAISRAPIVRRGVAYAGGVLVGVLPLAVYNQWAFGSITHLSYAGGQTGTGGSSGTGASTAELVAGGHFRLTKLLETLVGAQGIFTQAPVLVAGALGVVLLFRRRRAAEALAVAGVCAVYLVYNSFYGSNFGGFSPGQRYVIPILPFLALGIALAFRCAPLVTGALALASILVMASMTATHALAGYDLDWFHRIGTRDFDYTVAWLVGVTGWYTILPFAAAIAAAAVVAVRAAPPVRPSTLEPLLAGVALLLWALVAAGAPPTTALGGRADELGAYGSAGVAALVAVLAGVAAVWHARRASLSRGASLRR
ncbi:MAG: hypothetical protein ABI990_00780 [Actinomycetota bacterium]